MISYDVDPTSQHWNPAYAEEKAPISLGFRRQIFFPLKRKNFLQLILTAVLFVVFLFCEFLIYYVVIFQYSWPEV